jgi:hypothetical protein
MRHVTHARLLPPVFGSTQIFRQGSEIMHRFLLLVAAAAIASGSAFAADRSHLHGTYAFTGSSACIQDSASLGFNTNFTPKGPAIFYEFTVMGTRTFKDDGTGTVTGTAVSVGSPPSAFASSSSFTFQFTYTIDSSGMLSLTLVPGSFSGQELTGPRAGQTYVEAIPVRTGQVSEDARNIFISQAGTVVETVTYSNGDSVARVCNVSRVLSLVSHDTH